MTTNVVLRGMKAICTPSRCMARIGRAPVLARCQTQRNTVVSTGHAAVRHARSLTSSVLRIPHSASRHSLVITRAAATEAPVKQLADQQQGEPDAPEQLETVLLDVGGMKCGGCSAAVKRMLSARPEVSNAAVNLLTETAAVQLKLPSPSAAEDLAAMLTSKGFPATVRQNEGDAVDTTELEQKREQEARQSMVNLGVAWSLVLLCCTHHAGEAATADATQSSIRSPCRCLSQMVPWPCRSSPTTRMHPTHPPPLHHTILSATCSPPASHRSTSSLYPAANLTQP